jgi:hypothetical protein
MLADAIRPLDRGTESSYPASVGGKELGRTQTNVPAIWNTKGMLYLWLAKADTAVDALGNQKWQTVSKQILPLDKNLFDHPEREKMILKACHRFRMSEVEEYRQLPFGIKQFFSGLPYMSIVRPLVLYDRQRKGYSYPQLARIYKITKTQVRYICNPW